jgi:hypothetical protein
MISAGITIEENAEAVGLRERRPRLQLIKTPSFEEALRDTPEWTKIAVKRIATLMQLEENWDGYGAKPVQPNLGDVAINRLRQLIPRDAPPPQVVPTPMGGLQFEWHLSQVDVELEFVSPTSIHAAWEIDGTAAEAEFTSDLEELARVVSRLGG